MAAQQNTNANTVKISVANNDINVADEVKGKTVFHDFFGAPDSSPAAAQPSAAVGSAGCPVSTTSDMCSGPEASFRFSGSKRCNSDSIMGPCKDRFQPADSLTTSHVMKLLRSVGGERPRGTHNDETSLLGVQPMRQLSSSHSMGARTYFGNTSKWDRVPINASATLQFPPHSSRALPLGNQTLSNRFKDANNAGPSVISQAAADEGSRTGIKGSGILRSINTGVGVPDRALAGVPLSGSKHSFGIQNSEPESSNPNGRGVGSNGHQMTIFYGGQAHVFDDVHPNKADLIRALAGSNGGSWSTTYATKSGTGPSSEKNRVPAGENNETVAGSGSSSLRVATTRAFGSSDQIFLPPGVHQGGVTSKELRNAVQVAETLNEEKK